MPYFKTHVQRILARKSLLQNRLRFIFGQEAEDVSELLEAACLEHREQFSAYEQAQLDQLLEHGFVSTEPETSRAGRGSLMGCRVVNLELTYRCNYHCAHCLQKNLRLRASTELSTSQVKDIIRQAYLSGICDLAINITGGEVLGHRDDLFDLLVYSRSLGIDCRLNTNSWWARQTGIDICGHRFATAGKLVEYLKHLGLRRFAFSHDQRLVEPELMANFIESVKLCEAVGIEYEIIRTGVDPALVGAVNKIIYQALGGYPRYWLPGETDMVDIGGASELDNAVYARQQNTSSCEGRGFFHPAYVHVSPDGKIRSCMYAIGLANVGDLYRNTLPSVINAYPSNRIAITFASDAKKRKAFEELVRPYLDLYRPIRHECTRNVILAMMLETCSSEPGSDLNKIHRSIAKEMNLADNS